MKKGKHRRQQARGEEAFEVRKDYNIHIQPSSSRAQQKEERKGEGGEERGDERKKREGEKRSVTAVAG